jgi:hypothetical protein
MSTGSAQRKPVTKAIRTIPKPAPQCSPRDGADASQPQTVVPVTPVHRLVVGQLPTAKVCSARADQRKSPPIPINANPPDTDRTTLESRCQRGSRCSRVPGGAASARAALASLLRRIDTQQPYSLLATTERISIGGMTCRGTRGPCEGKAACQQKPNDQVVSLCMGCSSINTQCTELFAASATGGSR